MSKLPGGWSLNSLAEVAEIQPSNVDKVVVRGETSVRLCNYMDVYSNRQIDDRTEMSIGSATPSEIRKFGLKKGDVLMTKDSETPDDIGVPSYVAVDFLNTVCGYHLAQLRPNPKLIDGEFLAYQLRLPRTNRHFSVRASGSTRYGLSQSALFGAPIECPPLKEQRRIAEVLSTVDNLIEKTEALIAKQEAMTLGILADSFGRGVVEHGGNYRFGPSSADGPVPKNWKTESYKEVCDRIVVGIATSTTKYFVERGIPMLRNQNIRVGRIDISDLLEISPAFDKSNKSKRLLAGDIVTTRTGSPGPGISAVVPMWAEGWQTFTTLITTVNVKKVMPEFLCLFLNSPAGKAQIWQLQAGGAQQNLNVGWIEKMVVHYPSLTEQERIYNLVQTSAGVANVLMEEREKYFLIKKGLMSDLLEGRISFDGASA